MKLLNKHAQTEEEPETEVIIESDSLFCDVQAFVEKSNDCYYFYLYFDPLELKPYMETQKIKSCWICNRRKAPVKLDDSNWKKGQAPMMPAEFVDHDPNGIELDEDSLSIVWFDDGSSAALLSGEEIICVIPQWSGYKDFHGYSKYAKGTGLFAWEIKQAITALTERVDNARKLWSTFAESEQSAWKWLLHQHSKIEGFVGTFENDYNIANKTDKQIDATTFPPKVVASGARDGVIYGITAGVSLPAMPGAEMADSPIRMELGFASTEKHRQLCLPMYANLSMYASLPWQHITFLAHGHTVPLENIKEFAAVLFVDPDKVTGLEKPAYDDFPDSSKVQMLWVVPISQAEYDFIINNSMSDMMQRVNDTTKVHIFDGHSKFSV